MPRSGLSLKDRVWLFLEVAALGAALLGSLLWTELGEYAETNGGTSWLRFVQCLPWLGALLALGAAEALTRARPELAPRLRGAVQRALPLLALGVAPVLLQPTAFREQPVFLLLLTGAAALGLERGLRAAGGPPGLSLLRAHPLSSARHVPRLLLGLALLSATLALYGAGVRLHDKFMSSNFDLGLFENLFWNTLHGRHGIALEQPYFAQHAEFLLYLLLPVYALWPHTETLLGLQALLMVGAALPLFLLAERWLRSSWAALGVALAYLAHPALHGPALYDFHFLPLSAFFLLWAAYFHAARPGSPAFWAALLLALCCREDVSVGVGAVGLGLVWSERRGPARGRHGRLRRIGWCMALLGAGWLLLVKFGWMHQYGPYTFRSYYSELIPPGSRKFGGVLLTLLSNPVYALSRVLTAEKAVLALQLLVPLALLPVRYARAWFLLLPGLLVVGLADNGSPIVSVHLHYATHFLPYVFVAAVAALAVRSRSRRPAVLSAVLLASLVSTLHFGSFFRSEYKTSFHDVSFDWTDADRERARAFERLAALIPEQASVCAGEHEGPHLARRSQLFALKRGCSGADYVVFGADSLQWGGRAEVEQALERGTYGLVAGETELLLLGKGHDTTGNTETLRRLRGE